MAERNNIRSVIALGFFDGIHIGHAALLETAKRRAAEAGAEAAVLTFDNHPDDFVKKTHVALINSPADRNYILERWFGIRRVWYIHFNEDTMRLSWRDFLTQVTAAYGAVHFVVGHDFRFGYRGEGTAERLRGWCAARGLGCDVIPAVTLDGIVVSSTHIRSLLIEGRMAEAKRFLGHPHVLTDTVRTGFRIGRTLDFPTVNMRFAPDVLAPRHGVYASRVLMPEGTFSSVTNVGVRPTFEGRQLTVETHILGFDADLYGRLLTLEFHEFLRPEQPFPSPEALSAQIREDVARTREYFSE